MVSAPRLVTVQDRRAEHLDVGDGRPVLFLHGWGLGVRAYRTVHDQLAGRGLRVVAPALPGFGRTAPLPRDHTDFAGYADWVADFAATVGVDDAVVVGHSFGGGVATAVAHRHPDLVRGLVLVNAVGGASWEEGGRPLHERPLWDWGRQFPADLFPLRTSVRFLPALLREAVPNLLRRPGSLWRAGTLARSADLTRELGDLRDRGLPVAAVWADRDRVIPEAAFRDVCTALGADGHVVAGGHSWLLAEPAAVGELVTNVAELAAAAAAAHRPAARRRWWRRRPVVAAPA